MNRSRVRLLAVILGLALLAGPGTAACRDCCPEATEQTSVTSPAVCCGDCEPKVQRAQDPESLAAKKALVDPEPAATVPPCIVVAGVTLTHSVSAAVASSLHYPPPASPTPLRL